MLELSRILTALQSAIGQPAALATLVAIEGSSYRRPGARLLLLPDGTRIGSISGGCLEEDIIERAHRVLATGNPEMAVYDTTEENDLVWGVGTGCQGVVRIFLERIPTVRPPWLAALRTNLRERRSTPLAVIYGGEFPAGTALAQGSMASIAAGIVFYETIEAPPSLVLCGAGDDAQPLARMAKDAGWHLTIADTRPAYATAERFPEADAIMVGHVNQIASALRFDPPTFAVIMSHRYLDDLEFLRHLLPREFFYLGQLGPRSRTNRLLTQLEREGTFISDAQKEKFHAPVGLDLGGGTPETVALAILAEMQARRSGHAAGFLRDRTGPIHA